MSDYKFTEDWFSWAPDVWNQLIPHLPNNENFLEIGSYEGASATWVAENMMKDNSRLICIDTWQGGEEHKDKKMDEVEKRFDYNIARVLEKFPKREIIKRKGTSLDELAKLIMLGDNKFDFVYIDGSHIGKDVITDACMAFQITSSEGIIVFDDYSWGRPRDALHRPKLAIDCFTNLFGEHVQTIHSGYQLVVKKI